MAFKDLVNLFRKFDSPDLTGASYFSDFFDSWYRGEILATPFKKMDLNFRYKFN